MEYFEIVNLKKEPFSITPDPYYFYESEIHQECLNLLEIAVRTRRGLSVVIGGIGTGKTTLSRILLRRFYKYDPRFEFYLILDPSWNSELDFLKYLIDLFDIPEKGDSIVVCKDIIENYLYEKGVEEKKVLVLVIDEGQKISSENLELIRTLLNYETNQYKLIQVIFFAQPEFRDILQKHPNFADRVSMGYTLKPLSRDDAIAMIEHRLKIAGAAGGIKFFTDGALELIYLNSQGYPRKMITLCHDCLIEMIRQEKQMVDADIVISLLKGNRFFHVGASSERL
ncbi:ExeA family protein [Fidelibacter multiformis]|jgi:general secretion pathway protein A|uniref:ExeA family protein n=1 Tax=Fidelibacter multiformis TaxID=3377529 RepID=UPI0037DD8060